MTRCATWKMMTGLACFLSRWPTLSHAAPSAYSASCWSFRTRHQRYCSCFYAHSITTLCHGHSTVLSSFTPVTVHLIPDRFSHHSSTHDCPSYCYYLHTVNPLNHHSSSPGHVVFSSRSLHFLLLFFSILPQWTFCSRFSFCSGNFLTGISSFYGPSWPFYLVWTVLWTLLRPSSLYKTCPRCLLLHCNPSRCFSSQIKSRWFRFYTKFRPKIFAVSIAIG